MNRKVIIIGCGAAGMAAGIAAAREGAAVAILEHQARPGRKLLSTGNGKCNLTNYAMPAGVYRGDQPGFAETVLEKVTVKETLDFFCGIGILPMDRLGYVYPNSGQASSVLDALRLELEHLGVEIHCQCRVLSAEACQGKPPHRCSGNSQGKLPFDGFRVVTSEGTMTCDALLIAAGSMAAPATGSDGSGYELAGNLGHHILKPLPALVQLSCRGNRYKQLSGVRTEAEVTLLLDGRAVSCDRGELQFADYGISGIPVFQVSRYASRGLDEKRQVTAVLDLLPSMAREELGAYLQARKQQLSYRLGEEFLSGVLNKKLALVLLKEAGISLQTQVKHITEKQLSNLVCAIKSLEAVVTGTKSFEQAQVCCGGIDTRQVNPETMESKKQNNLFLAGEILDVDGICGGYNLQWAWSSGILAGRSAGRGLR